MTTHSSILAWKIPWTEEPGGLQFMGSQRVGDDLTHTLSTLHCEVSCTNHSCHLLAISFVPNTVGYIHYLFCFMERIQGLNAQCSGSLSW